METANNEKAAVTLVDGLHFAGDIGGEERVGGVGAGQEPHRLLPAFNGWLHGHGCPLDPAEKAEARWVFHA